MADSIEVMGVVLDCLTAKEANRDPVHERPDERQGGHRVAGSGE